MDRRLCKMNGYCKDFYLPAFTYQLPFTYQLGNFDLKNTWRERDLNMRRRDIGLYALTSTLQATSHYFSNFQPSIGLNLNTRPEK